MRAKPPMQDRRDIGEVVFPIEKMLAARQMSSCCVGDEALIEQDSSAIRMESSDNHRLKSFKLRIFRGTC